METKIKIDGKEYGVLYKGKTAKIYREYFNRDMLVDTQKAQMKFSEAIKNKVGTDEEDEPAYYVLLEANGSEFFERVLWACIKAYDVVQGKETEDFSDFIDNVVDYDTFVTVGIVVFEKIVFANSPTIDSESEDAEEKSKKKE